jgi:prepilin-type processing-associated H-X9-DG protein
MARRVTIIGFVLLILVVVGLFLTYLPKARLNANLVSSQNNLRELGLFAAQHSKPDQKRDTSKLLNEIPAGTIFLPNTPPEARLSWVVGVLPGLDQKRQNTAELITRIDPMKPWTAEANQKAGETRLVVLLCPENPPQVPAGSPAITCYVGIGGVGLDAPALPVGDPREGAFRYDTPTSFDHITDGISQTLLFAETRHEVGPWLRGGPATVRGLNSAPDALPLIGGQFGGYFPNGANISLCDGSVRVFTPQTTPRVLLDLATIAGKENGPLPPE